MAFTARLPEKLQTRAQALAADLGISLNALLAVALNDYMAKPHRATPSSEPLLEARASRYADLVPLVTPSTARSAVTQAAAPPPSPSGATGSVRPPASRSDPCPCGAVNRDGHRLKFKHCHGKP